MTRILIVFFAAIAALCSLRAGPAHAEEVFGNAVNYCQGSLPSFEGALRKRPLAIANQGTTTAFISCSVRAAQVSDSKPGHLYVYLSNHSETKKDMSCTMIQGNVDTASAYFPKNLSAVPNTGGEIGWALDAAYDLVNLNCALPPGVEIDYVYLT